MVQNMTPFRSIFIRHRKIGHLISCQQHEVNYYDAWIVDTIVSFIIETIVNPSILKTYSIIEKISPSSRLLLVSLFCNAINSSDSFCFFNQVHFSVFLWKSSWKSVNLKRKNLATTELRESIVRFDLFSVNDFYGFYYSNDIISLPLCLHIHEYLCVLMHRYRKWPGWTTSRSSPVFLSCSLENFVSSFLHSSSLEHYKYRVHRLSSKITSVSTIKQPFQENGGKWRHDITLWIRNSSIS